VNGEVRDHQELTTGPAEAMVVAKGDGAVLTTRERPVRWRSEHGVVTSASRWWEFWPRRGKHQTEEVTYGLGVQ
jgi:hypothetical protein